ncbi:hypothetical protein [Geminocystis sp. GBBB08]|uniref:hypothetical protein n=1 Tax=Geminocystis sp. GBBB08 TaxID=2604140 RepID=UPI0027E33BB6|nr:hypothetical protein [Geminocystis sp. GBBB08]
MYRKIYGFIQAIYSEKDERNRLWLKLNISEIEQNKLRQWWEENGNLVLNIASSSDRVNLTNKGYQNSTILVKHPISGQKQDISITAENLDELIEDLSTLDEKQLFWWLWRFLPELKAKQNPDSLLTHSSTFCVT